MYLEVKLLHFRNDPSDSSLAESSWSCARNCPECKRYGYAAVDVDHARESYTAAYDSLGFVQFDQCCVLNFLYCKIAVEMHSIWLSHYFPEPASRSSPQEDGWLFRSMMEEHDEEWVKIHTNSWNLRPSSCIAVFVDLCYFIKIISSLSFL